MARISEFRRLNPQDVDPDDQSVVETLGYTLNPFMQEVADAINGNLDFDNLNFEILTFDISVDSEGKPIQTNKIAVNKTNPLGIDVIRIINKQNPTNLSDSSPFIHFTPLGNGFVRMDKIIGIQPNDKHLIRIVVY